VKIPVKVRVVAVFPFAHGVCERAHIRERAFFKKENTVVERKTFTVQHFTGHFAVAGTQCRIGQHYIN
jgi:hypothetical protein